MTYLGKLFCVLPVTLSDEQWQKILPVLRAEVREYDRHLYRERHLIECFINKVKQYRRVFSRFEKLNENKYANQE